MRGFWSPYLNAIGRGNLRLIVLRQPEMGHILPDSPLQGLNPTRKPYGRLSQGIRQRSPPCRPPAPDLPTSGQKDVVLHRQFHGKIPVHPGRAGRTQHVVSHDGGDGFAGLNALAAAINLGPSGHLFQPPKRPTPKFPRVTTEFPRGSGERFLS